MKGLTSAGEEILIRDNLKDDFSFITLLRKADSNALAFVDVIEYAMEEKEVDKLKKACEVDGRVSFAKMRNEFLHILSTIEETKK